jgi:hypothetical protein
MAKFIETLPLWLFLAGAVLFAIGNVLALIRAYST